MVKIKLQNYIFIWKIDKKTVFKLDNTLVMNLIAEFD